jgi:hypothetical protein
MWKNGLACDTNNHSSRTSSTQHRSCAGCCSRWQQVLASVAAVATIGQMHALGILFRGMKSMQVIVAAAAWTPAAAWTYSEHFALRYTGRVSRAC